MSVSVKELAKQYGFTGSVPTGAKDVKQNPDGTVVFTDGKGKQVGSIFTPPKPDTPAAPEQTAPAEQPKATNQTAQTPQNNTTGQNAANSLFGNGFGTNTSDMMGLGIVSGGCNMGYEIDPKKFEQSAKNLAAFSTLSQTLPSGFGNMFSGMFEKIIGSFMGAVKFNFGEQASTSFNTTNNMTNNTAFASTPAANAQNEVSINDAPAPAASTTATASTQAPAAAQASTTPAPAEKPAATTAAAETTVAATKKEKTTQSQKAADNKAKTTAQVKKESSTTSAKQTQQEASAAAANKLNETLKKLDVAKVKAKKDYDVALQKANNTPSVSYAKLMNDMKIAAEKNKAKQAYQKTMNEITAAENKAKQDFQKAYGQTAKK